MTSRFEIIATPLRGLRLVQRKPIEDERGFLERLYCDRELESMLAGKRVAQANRTLTRMRGSVRGMHFQRPPSAETKVVACLRGSVFDVAVDVRAGSDTFLHWHGEVLSADNRRSLVIPEGFAHGFQTLSEDCEMLYFHTAAFSPGDEAGLNPLDPALAIRWPLPILGLSARDSSHALIADGFRGIDP